MMECHYEKISGGDHMRLAFNGKRRLRANNFFQYDVIHDLGGTRSCRTSTRYAEHDRDAQFQRRQRQHGCFKKNNLWKCLWFR